MVCPEGTQVGRYDMRSGRRQYDLNRQAYFKKPADID